jgi:hypothetical protein
MIFYKGVKRHLPELIGKELFLTNGTDLPVSREHARIPTHPPFRTRKEKRYARKTI